MNQKPLSSLSHTEAAISDKISLRIYKYSYFGNKNAIIGSQNDSFLCIATKHYIANSTNSERDLVYKETPLYLTLPDLLRGQTTKSNWLGSPSSFHT